MERITGIGDKRDEKTGEGRGVMGEAKEETRGR